MTKKDHGRARRGWWTVLVAVATLLSSLLSSGCIQQAAPEPALIRDSAPPWDAPRDAISHIRAAGLAELPLDDRSDPWILTMTISIDGDPVEIPAYIGVDRRRAIQAPVHTHDASGQVWLEGAGNRTVTLAAFFTLWGVRLSDDCLGNACGTITITADGNTDSAAPAQLNLRGVTDLDLAVTTSR